MLIADFCRLLVGLRHRIIMLVLASLGARIAGSVDLPNDHYR